MKDIQKKELALSSRAFPEAAAYPLKHSNAIKVSRKKFTLIPPNMLETFSHRNIRGVFRVYCLRDN